MCSRRIPSSSAQLEDHAPLGGGFGRAFQEDGVGEDDLVPLGPPLQHQGLGPEQHVVVGLDHRLAPGEGISARPISVQVVLTRSTCRWVWALGR